MFSSTCAAGGKPHIAFSRASHSSAPVTGFHPYIDNPTKSTAACSRASLLRTRSLRWACAVLADGPWPMGSSSRPHTRTGDCDAPRLSRFFNARSCGSLRRHEVLFLSNSAGAEPHLRRCRTVLPPATSLGTTRISSMRANAFPTGGIQKPAIGERRMAKMCDICGIRPATVRARVTTGDGESEVLDLCEVDYRRLARQQRSSSPMESLFGGRSSLFDDFFGNDFFGRGGGEDEDEDRGGRSIPVRSGRSGRGRGEADERLSEHAQELLQHAAQRTVEFGRREVDTEHLLLALTESDVVRTILEQFKVSVDELRRQLEQDAPRGEKEAAESGEIGVTPRVKSVIGRAFAASRELGHSYVGPEHFLIGLPRKMKVSPAISCAATD